jgi:hypothetical protein
MGVVIVVVAVDTVERSVGYREKHHMWDEVTRLSLDVRSVPVIGTSSPCGRNLENSSTRYPQKLSIFPLIHILET